MTMISKSTLGICVGVVGALFVGYCIYFDKKRHSDPSFRKKLREKRRKGLKSAGTGSVKWPDLKNAEEVQKFFLACVATGEELLASGDIQGGVTHLSRAVAICGQPQQLLQVLQNTLPPQIFQMLLAALPAVGASIMKIAEGAEGGASAKVTEDDVE